jgi:hypothetical protein
MLPRLQASSSLRLVAFLALQPGPQVVADIDSVVIRPSVVIRSSDAVSVVVGMVTPYSAGSLYHTSGINHPGNRGPWVVKAERLSYEQKLALSRAVDALAHSLERRYWETPK